VYRPIAELRPDARNPRLHAKKQIHQIAQSIEAFDFNVPVLIDGQSQIVAGHGRVRAAQGLGFREVPTICLDHLTDAQARAFLIADNRLTENSSWDEQLLAHQLKELAALDIEFDLDVTGFETPEIDLLIEGLTPASPGADDPADTVPDVGSDSPVSRAGDLWLLGPHRVFCGSALDDAAYASLMGNQRAAIVFTDPPYNVRIAGHASGLGKVRHRDFVMASGELGEAEFTTFLLTAGRLLTQHSIDGSMHFICMDWRHLWELLNAGRQVYTELKNICVWTKDHPGMGSLYRSQHELIMVFKHGKAAHRNHVQLGQFGRSRSNVWHYPSATSFSRATDEGHLLSLHPTVKPVQLVADALLDCSRRGEIVLDPFLGSGTTLIAAQRTGRMCHGLELDPRYVDVTIRRWQAYTGDRARHAGSGKWFDQLTTQGGSRHHAQHTR
jgi:DNA modification methylase